MTEVLLARGPAHRAVECVFCDDYLARSLSEFDQSLRDTDSVRLLPCFGHAYARLLLGDYAAARVIHGSARRLERKDFVSSVSRFVGEMKPIFGDYCLFEHGSVPTSGACISHAHIHLHTSRTKSLGSLLESALPWRRLGLDYELHDLAELEYGHLRTPNGDFLPRPSAQPMDQKEGRGLLGHGPLGLGFG